MSSSCCSSEGDASPRTSASTIVRRPGSPRAAWTAARRATSICSVNIDSIIAELCTGVEYSVRPGESGTEPAGRAQDRGPLLLGGVDLSMRRDVGVQLDAIRGAL